MSAEVLVWSVLAGALLVCLGILLGATWTTQALQPKLRQQAEERRELNNQWAVLRDAREKLERCPRCGYLLTARSWPLAATLVERPADDS